MVDGEWKFQQSQKEKSKHFLLVQCGIVKDDGLLKWSRDHHTHIA